jgi:hypothetical protein
MDELSRLGIAPQGADDNICDLNSTQGAGDET